MRSEAIGLMTIRAVATAQRFPASILAALVATGAALTLIEPGDHRATLRLFLVAALGISALTTAQLVAEERRWARGLFWSAAVALLAGLVGLWFASQSWSDRLLAIRFAQLGLVAHLLVAWLPFQGRTEGPEFWQFNRLLFQRVLLGGVFGGVLFAGLAVALVAVKQLFGLAIENEVFPRLLAVIVFLFHPWFTLAGVPRHLSGLDGRNDYPQLLKVFTQYILIPIVAVYLAILTAYLGRVVITRIWPSGWIGYLVSSVAATGTLALLLVHPIRERAEGRWVNPFARWYFVALIPALVMLLLAVGKRVDQYGITEPRYALAMLGWWLLVLAVFFAVTQSRSIRIIPVSLALVTLVTVVGPWSITASARRSQIGRYRQLAAALGRPAPSDLAMIRRELSGAASYLWHTHGPAALADAAAVPRDSVGAWVSGETDLVRAALARVGLEPLWTHDNVGAPQATARFVPSSDSLTPLEPVQLGEWLAFAPGELLRPFRMVAGNDTVAAAGDQSSGRIEFRLNNGRVSIDLGAVLDSLAGALTTDQRFQRTMPITAESPEGAPLPVRIILTSARWVRTDPTSRSASGLVLLKAR